MEFLSCNIFQRSYIYIYIQPLEYAVFYLICLLQQLLQNHLFYSSSVDQFQHFISLEKCPSFKALSANVLFSVNNIAALNVCMLICSQYNKLLALHYIALLVFFSILFSCNDHMMLCINLPMMDLRANTGVIHALSLCDSQGQSKVRSLNITKIIQL